MEIQESRLRLWVNPQYCKLSTYQSINVFNALIIEINCSLFIIVLLD